MFHAFEVELGETMGALFATVERFNPARVVIDSLSELRLLSQRPLRYRRQILALKQFFAERQDAARLRAGQPLEVRREATDLVALAQAVVTAVQHGTERHQLSVTTTLSALVAPVDPLRVERVLDNLLLNAVKYSPAGGAITVAVDVAGTGGGAWAVVQVRD